MSKKLTSYELAKLGMMSIGEVELLKECVLMAGAKPLIANIGAGVGTSAVAMLEANEESIIFSFDNKPVAREREVVVEAGFDPARVIRILGNSWEKAQFLPVEFDLVFVDGAHDDPAVKNDIQAFVPLLTNPGIILFHDYQHPNLPGLTKIVDYAMRENAVIGASRYLIAFMVE